jgi:hypothetical protein
VKHHRRGVNRLGNLTLELGFCRHDISPSDHCLSKASRPAFRSVSRSPRLTTASAGSTSRYGANFTGGIRTTSTPHRWMAEQKWSDNR